MTKKLRELRLGDEIAAGFTLTVALPDRLAILGPRSPRGGELSPYFEAQRALEGGRAVARQSASSIEALTAKCDSWLAEQLSRKDNGALKHRPVRVLVGMRGARSAAPPEKEAA